jgi:hypothetical protein
MIVVGNRCFSPIGGGGDVGYKNSAGVVTRNNNRSKILRLVIMMVARNEGGRPFRSLAWDRQCKAIHNKKYRSDATEEQLSQFSSMVSALVVHVLTIWNMVFC